MKFVLIAMTLMSSIAFGSRVTLKCGDESHYWQLNINFRSGSVSYISGGSEAGARRYGTTRLRYRGHNYYSFEGGVSNNRFKSFLDFYPIDPVLRVRLYSRPDDVYLTCR